MQIDQHKCVACSNCIAVCPVGAIYIDPRVNRATATWTSAWSVTPATTG
ncbi:MAG: 4Fe-4S binding protein [candidate division NC10 bacterium]|nr:4Fe-4S binding protein [candidate division NC10 bacterium]